MPLVTNARVLLTVFSLKDLICFLFIFQFRQAFQKVSSPMHFRTTLLLSGYHLLIGFIYMGVATFSFSILKQLRGHEYLLHKQYIDNGNYSEIVFNHSMENIQYANTIFKNATFINLSLNHVDFINCTIEESDFINVKSSVTFFRKSTIKETR